MAETVSGVIMYISLDRKYKPSSEHTQSCYTGFKTEKLEESLRDQPMTYFPSVHGQDLAAQCERSLLPAIPLDWGGLRFREGATVAAAESTIQDNTVSAGPLCGRGRECRFGDGHPARCEVVSRCSFNLHFSNDELYWSSFHKFMGHLNIFGEIAIPTRLPTF